MKLHSSSNTDLQSKTATGTWIYCSQVGNRGFRLDTASFPPLCFDLHRVCKIENFPLTSGLFTIFRSWHHWQHWACIWSGSNCPAPQRWSRDSSWPRLLSTPPDQSPCLVPEASECEPHSIISATHRWENGTQSSSDRGLESLWMELWHYQSR